MMHHFSELLLEQKLACQISEDFPHDTTPASLSGAQPKLAGRMIAGRFVVGLTATERFERWELCEDLAHQLVVVGKKEQTSFPKHAREVTLQRIRRAIEGKGWVSVVEADWLVERLRALLHW